MEINQVFDEIQKKYSTLPPECIQELLGLINPRPCRKNEILVSEGDYAQMVYFIVNGCARAYYLKDGRDISDWFALENEFICSIVSFFDDKPSPHFIQTLEDSLLIEIPRQAIDQLSMKYHAFEKLMRLVVTETMLSQQQRISSILFYSAEEKYRQLEKDHPQIIQRVPLMHIASHLGMTLETLSRVRSSKI